MAFTENQLAKIIRKEYTPPMPGYPGHPGRPAIEGGWRRFTETRCGFSLFSNLVRYTEEIFTGTYDEDGKPIYLYNDTINEQASRESEKILRQQFKGGCQEVTFLRYVPSSPRIPAVSKQPDTPAKTLIDYQIGWNARAHSVAPLQGGGAFRFKVPRGSSGVVVGLTAQPKKTGYNDIAYGFFVESGVVHIIESGQQTSTVGANPDAELIVARSSGQIVYMVGGQVVRVRPNNSEPMYLSAALYTGGDTVEDAELIDFASAVGEMTPLVGYAGDALINQAVGSLMPMTGRAGSYTTGSASGSFLPMQGAAADASGYAFASGTFLPMTGEAESFELAPSYAFADGEMYPLTGMAEGVMHISGTSEGAFSALAGISSEAAYAQSVGSFLPMTGESDSYEGPDQALIASVMVVAAPSEANSVLFALIDSEMNIVGLFTVTSTETAQLMSSLNLSDDFALAQTLRAAIESWMEANANAFDPSASAVRDVWVYHMDANGSTRYEGYDFDGFTRIGDAYYGIKSDGIYRLEGPDDNGTQVPARVNFGNLSFGTMARKALPYVYVGMSSSGDTYLKVTADGQTYTYRVRDNTDLMKAHRYELGRGLRASFYDIELVADGTVFDLHNIEFQPIELNRRL